ncbi:MAG: hypothetical protein GY854_26885 [Deltaproteobacteria bacterium]|nr:hypothetical protein [Deltaproteobacteria bacterium]
MYRDMAGFRRKSQALRNAKRTYSRSLYDNSEIEEDFGARIQRVNFTCFYLCGDCGYLADKPAVACPSCGEKNWLDLRDVEIAEMVQENETTARMRIPKVVDGILISLFFVIAFFTLIIFQDPDWSYDMSGWFLIIGEAVIAVPVFLFFRRHLAKLHYRMFSRRPVRWRMPSLASTGGKPDRCISGKAKCGELLKAPFSGEPCIAYKASVLFDSHGDARPPEWVLAEVTAVDFEIEGSPVLGERVMVDVKLEPVLASATTSSELEQFLRARGLFLEDGEFTFFEALVTPTKSINAGFYNSSETIVLNTANS